MSDRPKKSVKPTKAPSNVANVALAALIAHPDAGIRAAAERALDHAHDDIAPAWTETDMAAPSFQKLGYENVRKAFPLGRIGKVDDVANATLFLLSPLAEFITGTTVTVDGGMAMRG